MIPDYQRYRYEKHCIQEAIFEVKFSTENFDSTLPGQFYEKVRNEFPEKNDLKVITIALGAAPSDTPPATPRAPTMQTWNQERQKCLQIGPGIMAANILNYSYIGWEDFKQTIDILLNSYFQCAQPRLAQRLGLRYVNRFVFPEENVTLSDYVKLNINLPSMLNTLSAFDLNVLNNYSYEGYGITTKLRFSSDALKQDEQGVAFILDIDSFVTNNIPTETKEILHISDLCHDYLKAVFEDTLQDKTRKLLGGKKI